MGTYSHSTGKVFLIISPIVRGNRKGDGHAHLPSILFSLVTPMQPSEAWSLAGIFELTHKNER